MTLDSIRGVLAPASVPWMVSPSVPWLRLEDGQPGEPSTISFIGYFQLEREAGGAQEVQIIHAPAAFAPSNKSKGAAHRMIRVQFFNVHAQRLLPAVADSEVISEIDYDWTHVPGGPTEGESSRETLERFGRAWSTTGICPDPRFYEVRNSAWIAELALAPSERKHFIVLGHDEYFEVIAAHFVWEPGQEVA